MKHGRWLFARAQCVTRNGLLFILLNIGMIQTPVAQQLIGLSHHEGPITADQLRYAIEGEATPEGMRSREQISALPWHSAKTNPVNLGYRSDAAWFHFRLHNDTDKAQERFLELAYPLLDDVRSYVYSGTRLLSSTTMGDRYPFTQRPIKHRNLLQSLQLNSGEILDIYLRVQTTSSLQVPISLWRAEKLANVASSHALLMGIYFGTLLVMLLYNFSIYVNGRDTKYLSYVFYLASIGLFFAAISGIGFQYFWPQSPHLTNLVIITSLGSGVFFAGLFSSSFLGLANTRPYLYRGLRVLVVAAVAIIVSGLFLPYAWAIKPAIALVLVAAILGITCGILRWRDGHSAAMLFTTAWMVLLVGAVFLGFSKIGWLPRTRTTEHLIQIGSMIEFMLFSLALLRQLNAERRAKFAAQRSSLAFERQASESRKQALEMQRQATDELELRVRQRTQELQILNEKLRTLSTTDPLTGLKNRRYFNERFMAEFVRSKRDKTPLSVIVIDIDHFKSVNDTHGHLLGDELLKLVAHNIGAQAKRASDIIARHGGEEFSAVLVNNTPQQALDMAEAIREQIETACYQADDLSLQCTVSIGVATMVPGKHNVAEELLKQADDALYQSKAEGRNRVSEFSQRAA